MKKLWVNGSKTVWDYSKRDYEDTVRSVVDKLKIGKDKPRNVIRGE